MAINRDAWLAALATVAPPSDDEALSTAELAHIFGLKLTTTKERIKRMVKSGAATVSRKRVTDALGRTQTVTAWRLIDPNTANKVARKRR